MIRLTVPSLRGLLAAACLLAVVPQPARATCPGDCDGDATVTVDEILRGVNIALGSLPLGDCPVYDVDASGGVEVNELVAAVNAALAGCAATATATPTATAPPPPTATAPPAATPIFPASYRNSYIEVRSCRFSVEHGGGSVRVLASPRSADAYLGEENPLPVGSIIVKEEYTSSDCSNDANLVRWSAMRKEAPGFDAEHGDWRWQEVNRNRTVAVDGKATCVGCHLAPACVARDYMCTEDIGGPRIEPLRLIFDGLPAALLAVGGAAPDDVVVVGADPGDGRGPYVLHYDGRCWKRLDTGASGTLWWITFTPIDGALYMVGEGGLILRHDLGTRTFEQFATPPGDPTLFGIWGAAADDLWAVGGQVGNENGGGVLWHYDGVAWSPIDLGSLFPAGVPTLFKIWGRSADDIYAVGRSGTILHYDGERWTLRPSNTIRPLFTVHGNQSRVVATGGFIDGVLVEDDGSGFVERTPRSIEQLNGVFVPPAGTAVAIGNASTVALRGDEGWVRGASGIGTPRDFHAVWIDPEGGIWGVGGDLTVSLSDGVLVYGGDRLLPTAIDDGEGAPCGS